MMRKTWTALAVAAGMTGSAATSSTAPVGQARPARQVPSQPVQSYDSYKSWFVVCDNTRACVAKGFGDGGDRTELSITREPGPAGALRFAIAAEVKFTLAELSVDGRKVALEPKRWTSASDDSGGWASTTDLGEARAAIAALRDGTELTLGGDARVPLDGFAASMLQLDERQGRVGGVTALFKSGLLPASRVLPALPLPLVREHVVTTTLAAGEDRRLIARVRREAAAMFKAEDCSERDGIGQDEAYALGSDTALVLIPCLMGAYQGSSLAFVVPRTGSSKIVRLVLDAPYAGNTEYSRPLDMFTEASFDPKTGMFFTAAKGRGLADCGMSASWAWDGRTWTLADHDLQQSCGGVEPGDWPPIYRSRQK